MTCHAGACHGEPADRGVWGWLCAPCWSWCVRWIWRLTTTRNARGEIVKPGKILDPSIPLE